MHTGPVSILQGGGMAMHFACQHILERLCGYSRACQHISGFLTYTPSHLNSHNPVVDPQPYRSEATRARQVRLTTEAPDKVTIHAYMGLGAQAVRLGEDAIIM